MRKSGATKEGDAGSGLRSQQSSKQRSLGRNDPCHCGSGRKYKKCCLDKDREVARGERPAFTIDGSESPTVNEGHIVPRMYQAAWEDEQRRVAVHRVPENGVGCRARSTKRVTTRGAYYRRTRPDGQQSDDVEDSLRRLEDKATEPLRSLVDGGEMGEEAKGTLAQLFSVQMFRGPAFFSHREELVRPRLETAGAEDFTRYGLAAAGGDLEVVREKAIGAYLDPTKRFVTMMAYAVKAASVLGLMRWQILRFEQPVLAYSDHPVVLWPNGMRTARPFAKQGIGALQALEIRVPISSEAAILMNWIDRDDVGAMAVPVEAASELNAFTVSQAEKEWMHKLGSEPDMAEGNCEPLSRFIDPAYDAREARQSLRHGLASQHIDRVRGKEFVNEVEVLVWMDEGRRVTEG